MSNIHKFDILITLTSHLHIGSADKSQKVDPDTGYFGSDGFPAARTQHIRIPNAANNAEGEDAGNAARYREVPWIPPFTIRGYLRRKVAAIVKERLMARGEQLNFDTYHALMCGARTAAPEGTENAQELLVRMQHPVVGLVGGGPKMVRSHLTVTSGMPITQDMIDIGLVPDAYAEYAVVKTRNLTQPLCFRRVDDVLTGSDPQMVSVIANFSDALKEWIQSNASNKKARSEDRANKERGDDRTKKSDLMSFQFIEGIMPTVSFHSQHQIDIAGPGLAGLGLYLLALEKMANEQRLGGKVASGFGQFSLKAFHHEEGTKANCLVRDTTDSPYRLNTDIAIVSEAIGEWNTFDIKAAELETLFS